MVRSSQLISTFGICFHSWQEPHISDEFFKQRRGVVLPPDQSERQRQFQICHWQQRHPLGTSPTGGTADERHTQPARNKAKNGCLIRCFLDDAWRFQAATETFVHQAIIVAGALPPRKPNKICINHVAQSEFFYLCKRMTFGCGQY